MGSPRVHLGRAGAKADVALTKRAVRGNGNRRAGGRRLLRLFGIEDEEDLVAAAIEHVPSSGFRERLEPEHVAVEPLGRVEIGRVEDGFENALGGHCRYLARSKESRSTPVIPAKTV